LHIGSDGAVAQVDTILTTDHQLLDDTAVSFLRRWRCQPHSLQVARVSMTFDAGRGLVNLPPPSHEKNGTPHTYFLSAPHPGYPVAARRLHATGYGEYFIRFAPDGHASKVVVFLSTGSPILDKECEDTLLRWRCDPGVYTTVKLPLTFTIKGSR
jgi:outer membrane biosynthesis protein TonB